MLDRKVVVPVVVPDPVHDGGLVAALRREVEVVVGADQQVGPARIGRIGVEDVAAGVLVEDAQAVMLAFGEPWLAIPQKLGLGSVVVLDGGYGFIRGDVEVVVEVAAIGRHPREPPAHALFECLEVGQARATTTRDTS